MFEKFKHAIELHKVNKTIAIATLLLVVFGLFSFLSASMGILGRDEVKFYGMLNSQLIAYVIGIVALLIGFTLPYIYYFRFAPAIFFITLLLASAVLIPGLGLSHGGATRWIDIGGFSLQPAELLKLSTVLMIAWFIKKYTSHLEDWRYSMGIFGGIMALVAGVMFLQRDIGSLLIIAGAATMIYFVGGAKWRHLLIFFTLAVVAVGVYASQNAYILNRINVFSGADGDPLDSSYQTRQALIAVGSGGVFGRGPGQSVQKFSYLPEPVGDSIFAVTAEEFGFVGSSLVVALFGIIIIASLLAAQRKKEYFAKSIIVGIATIIFLQTTLNIASMINLIPLSGDTLPFFSQGGTALILNLFEIGLLLQLTKRTI